MVVLLTGGTGTLGRAVDEALRAVGESARVLSRRPEPAGREPGTWATGNLRTGRGIDAAVAGVGTIVHCATTGTNDVRVTANLIAAAQRAARAAGAQPPHLVYISIVGIDRIPMFYYRAKLESERLVEASGLPWTILRATQFHDLVAGLFRAQRRLPVLVAPSVSFQPVDVRDVAARLVELALAPAAGRVTDLGGPQVRTARELAEIYQHAQARRRRVLPLTLPGRAFAALRSGANLVPDGDLGHRTFEQYLTGPNP